VKLNVSKSNDTNYLCKTCAAERDKYTHRFHSKEINSAYFIFHLKLTGIFFINSCFNPSLYRNIILVERAMQN